MSYVILPFQGASTRVPKGYWEKNRADGSNLHAGFLGALALGNASAVKTGAA